MEKFIAAAPHTTSTCPPPVTALLLRGRAQMEAKSGMPKWPVTSWRSSSTSSTGSLPLFQYFIEQPFIWPLSTWLCFGPRGWGTQGRFEISVHENKIIRFSLFQFDFKGRSTATKHDFHRRWHIRSHTENEADFAGLCSS